MPDRQADAPHVLDLRGLRCPLPVLRLEATLRKAIAGQRFEVLSDDPIAAVDIPHAMAEAGHLCTRKRVIDPVICVFEVTAAR